MLFIVDKPTGFTSFDLIRKLKKIYRGEKIGHAGTLDPLATGVMLIAIGKDTKKLRHLVGLDKRYRTTVDLTLATDTWDTDEWKWKEKLVDDGSGTWQLKDKHQAKLRGYEHLAHGVSQQPTEDDIKQTLTDMIGELPQPLTPFSAKKIRGKKLYEYAREGEPIHFRMPMTVHDVTLIDYTFPLVTIEFNVGSGTYIRSLAYELGRKLGRAGALTTLRRLSVGEFGFGE